MKKILKRGEFWVLLFVFLCLGFIYRGVLFNNQVIFPTQFLASFYSPWATQRYPEYPNGLPNKPIGGNDQIRMFYPYRTFITDSLLRGELPLWNPYNFAGSPLFANFQSAVLYPLNIVYLLMPQINAWSLLVFIQPLLGTLFMYIYLRNLSLRKLAAFLGGFSFGFSGFILTWSMENAVVGQAVLWFPLVLYGVDLFIKRVSGRRFLFLVIVLATCLLAGHLQTFFFIYLVGFCYGLFRIATLPRKVWFYYFSLFASLFISSVLLCSIQLLPSIEAFLQSTRGSVTDSHLLATYLVPVTQVVTAIAPDIFGNPGAYNYYGPGFYHEQIFYLGLVPLIFAVVTIFTLRQEKTVRFFAVIAIVSFFFSISSPFTEWFYRQPIPIISTFTPSRILFVTSTALSILAGYGFNDWITRGAQLSKRLAVTVCFIASFLGLFLGYLVVGSQFNTSLTSAINTYIRVVNPFTHDKLLLALRNSVLPFSMLGVVFISAFLYPRIKIIAVTVVLVACLGQFYFLNKYVILGDKRFLFPEHFVLNDLARSQNKTDRFLSFGLPILGDFAIQNKLYSPDGIDPVFSNRYGQLVFAAKQEGVIQRDIPRIEVNLSEYAENTNIYDNERRQRLISLLGVTTVYNYERDYHDSKVFTRIFPSSRYTALENRDNWQKYSNTAALPRAFLADSFIVKKNSQEIADTIFLSSTDLRRIILLEESPRKVEMTPKSSSNDQAVIKKYSPQHVQITVNADVARMLFLSDVFYPGWEATIDGKGTHIYRADYAFRAIEVPQGIHQVEFTYKPISLRVGTIVSFVTLFALVIGYLILSKRVTAKPLDSF